MLPSKAIITGAAVAGLLTGSFAVRSYATSVSGTAVSSLHNLADQDKGKHGCGARIHAKDKVDARLATTVAKAKIPAKEGWMQDDGEQLQRKEWLRSRREGLVR